MLRIAPLKYVSIGVMAGYIIYVIYYGYSWIPNNLSKVLLKIINTPYLPLGNILLAAPFLLVGVWNNRISLSVKIKSIGIVFSGLFWLCEVSALYYMVPGSEKYSYVFATLPVCFFVFAIIKEWKVTFPGDYSILLRNVSTLIYCVHPLIINLCQLNGFYQSQNSVCKYMIMLSLSLVFAILINFLSIV